MSARDPKWIRLALKAYDACLPLYPREVLEAHGEEMRQAFRDRCREVARGQQPAWRLFGRELMPDLLASTARAHFDAVSPAGDRRVMPGLALLCLLILALATQASWSVRMGDALQSLNVQLNIAREKWTVHQSRKVTQTLTSALVSQGDAESIAVASLAQRSLADQDWTWSVVGDRRDYHRVLRPEAGAAAAQLAMKVLEAKPSLAALSLAAQACIARTGCDQDRALRTLLTRDPENAFNWSLEFRRAARVGNASRMQAALEGAARSRYFESHVATVQHALFALALAEREDLATLEHLGERFQAIRGIGSDEFEHNLLYHCSQSTLKNPHPARWTESHPAARLSCLRVARLLAASGEAWPSVWGWRQLAAAGELTTPAKWQAARDVAWVAQQSPVGGIPRADFRGQTPWTESQWARWSDCWKMGDSELAARRCWLISRGVSIHAPASFISYFTGDGPLSGG